MELEGSSNGESSVAFLERLRERHGGRLGVIWDNAPVPLRQAQEGSGDAVIPGDPRPEPAAGYLPGYKRAFVTLGHKSLSSACSGVGHKGIVQ